MKPYSAQSFGGKKGKASHKAWQKAQKKPKRQQDNKPKHSDRGKGKGGRGGGASVGDLLDPSTLISGKALRRGAKALTRLELQPQIGAYKRLIGQLGTQKTAEAGGLEALGNRTAGATGDVYRNLAHSQAENIARTQAIGNQLTQQTGQNVQDARGNLVAGQAPITNEAAALPGGGVAQQQLAQMVAAQQNRQAQEGQAQQNLASSQSAGYSQLASAMGQAEQSRGAEAQRDIRQGITSRIAESNLKHNLDISEAQGKLAETRSLRGPTRAKNLFDLREKERDYILGQGAIAQRGQAAKLSAATSRKNAALSSATSRRGQNISAATSKGNAALSQKGQNRRQKQGQRWDLKHPSSSDAGDSKKAYKDIAAVGSNYLATHNPSSPNWKAGDWNILAGHLYGSAGSGNRPLVNAWIKKQKQKYNKKPAASTAPFQAG